MRATKDPLFQKFISVAEAHGWTVELTGKSHWCFTPADKTLAKVYTSGSPGDKRAILNFRRDLRHRGLPV